MALLLTFVILAVALAALFWGGGLLLQAWLYNVPAARLGLRAAVAGAGVALFLTFWCWVDARNPDKYSTLLNFAQYEVEEIDKVDAVRKRAHREGNKWLLDKKEEVATYTRRPGGRSTADFVDASGKPWKRSEGDGMVVALRVKEKDKKEPTQFNAQLDPATGGFPSDGPRYLEERGRRYIDAGNIGHIIRSRSALVLWNILLNLLMFVVWLAAIWLGLRFGFGHAFGLAFALWLAMELVLLPVLFQQTRPTTTPATPPATPATTKTAALHVGPATVG